MAYGIIAYGKSFTFKSKKEYKKYLLDWMQGTEGAERDRAVEAFVNLEEGFRFTDTDRGIRAN